MKDWPQGLNSWAKPATAANATVQATTASILGCYQRK